MMRLAILFVCVGASVAAAQPANQAEAERHFAEGRRLLVNENDAPGACMAFEKAIDLDPTAPGVMLNLGLCNELQGKFATSLYWFRKAQFAAAEAKPPLPEYEEEAKKHTQDLTDKVLLAQLKDVPENARVSIDGRPVRRDEYSRLEVDPDSVVEVRVPGKQVFRQKVEVEGERTAKAITLVLQDEVVPAERDPGKGRRRLAVIVGVGGVVLYGITLTYGLVVRSRYNTVGDGHYEDPETGFDDAERDLRWKGTGLFVAGTAAIGAAVVLWLTAPKPYRERIEQARVLPIVTPDGVGVGYTGSF